MTNNLQDVHILQDAVAALQRKTGLTATILPAPKDRKRQADGFLEIDLNGQKRRFIVEIKTADRYIAVAQIRAQLDDLIAQFYPGYRPLFVTGFATPRIAEECRRLDLPYLDTAGNLYLREDHVFLDIRGNPKPPQAFNIGHRANRPAGLKTIFALLCRPALADTTYRELAKAANVALGAIGPVLDDLARRGYLRRRKTNGGTLMRRDELLKEWTAYYPANLRPTLNPRRYHAERALLIPVDIAQFNAYWGGEFGAERLTHYLKAEHFVVYAEGVPPALMKAARMRLAANGNVEILQTFWNPELTGPDPTVVPPLLVYADLIATAEPRNLETAQEIYDRFLRNPPGQP